MPLATHAGEGVLVAPGAGALGGLLPDLDHPDSSIGRWLPWPAMREGPHRVGRWRPGRVIWHRDEVHSLGAAAIAAALAGVAIGQAHTWLLVGAAWVAAIGVVLGYLSHLGADLLSPTPQMLLWPLSRPRWRPRWLPAAAVESVAGRVLEAMASVAALLILAMTGRSMTLSFLHPWRW